MHSAIENLATERGAEVVAMQASKAQAIFVFLRELENLDQQAKTIVDMQRLYLETQAELAREERPVSI